MFIQSLKMDIESGVKPNENLKPSTFYVSRKITQIQYLLT